MQGTRDTQHKPTMIRNRLLSFLLASFLFFPQLALTDELAFFDQSLGDFSEELENARDEGKKGVLIFFEMDECPFCHRMKTTILNQQKVVDYFKKHFMIYSVDIEGDVEIVDFKGNTTTQKDFAYKQHRVRATPVIAFFDLEGNRIVRYTGATSSPEEFMLLGEFVVSGAYKDTRFTRYKRSKRN